MPISPNAALAAEIVAHWALMSGRPPDNPLVSAITAALDEAERPAALLREELVIWKNIAENTERRHLSDPSRTLLPRVIGLLWAMVENEPDDDAADAVTCWMVWKKEAADLLALLDPRPAVQLEPVTPAMEGE